MAIKNWCLTYMLNVDTEEGETPQEAALAYFASVGMVEPVKVELLEVDGEPVESEPDKMWHVTITYKYGTLPSIHRTEAGAKRALAQYVAQEWENVMGATERPENDEEAVRMYFETHESEWYDATEVTVADWMPSIDGVNYGAE